MTNVGITAYGIHVPWYRLNRKVISTALGALSGGSQPGEKAVANHDEDSLTMAVAASIDCLKNGGKSAVNGLLFASTTAPYRERESATIIATALDLGPEVRTADIAGSLRGGITALITACEMVSAGTDNVLVCAADRRLGKPGSPYEAVVSLLMLLRKFSSRVYGQQVVGRWPGRPDGAPPGAGERRLRNGYITLEQTNRFYGLDKRSKGG